MCSPKCISSTISLEVSLAGNKSHPSPPHPQEFSLSSLHLTVREMEGPLFQDTASVIAIGNVPVLSFARWEHYTVVQLVPVEHTLAN